MGTAAILWAMATVARATDTWSTVRDGVDYLHRVDPTPWDIHAVRVDLTSPAISLRASKDEYDVERHVVNSTFAQDVGALVAINGDWSDTVTPVGLAIGDGQRWHEHYDDPAISGTWGVFGCDAFNGCDIQSLPPASQAWWFNPSIAPYRYLNAVGTNGLLLIDDGVPLSGCYDGCDGDVCRNPRSAVCLEQDLSHLWLIAVDGRQYDSAGMTCGEMRTLALELGCWDAAMLDGGGSTTLWVDGGVVNDPSDGAQRVVANHVAVVYTPTADPACALSSGSWCDGSVIATCTGGRFLGSGDCGFFGLTCQEDGDWAFCVDPRCPGGDGTASDCLDATRVAGCTDGLYGEGDCGVFGLVCGEDAIGAGCMDPRCEAGPNSPFCTDAGALAQCTAGVYAESACAPTEQCDAATASCLDARCASADDASCQGDVWEGCTAGVYQFEDCAATGLVCADDLGCVPAEEGGDTPDDPSANGRVTPGGGCGCSSAAATPGLGGWAGLVALMAWWRRRP